MVELIIYVSNRYPCIYKTKFSSGETKIITPDQKAKFSWMICINTNLIKGHWTNEGKEINKDITQRKLMHL